MPRGGKRAGAGRKPSPSKKIQIRVKFDEYDKIEIAAEKHKTNVSHFCKKAVMKVVENED